MNQFARPGLAVNELPSFNENDKGKVLKIDSETGVLGWGEAGGSGLPSTDAASAGDVLSLDNSKDPQWSAPSSGGGVLVVHETVSDMTHTLDKTWQEIVDAGFAVLYITRSNGSTDIYELRNFDHNALGYQVTFYDLQQGSWAYQVDSATGYPSYEE